MKLMARPHLRASWFVAALGLAIFDCKPETHTQMSGPAATRTKSATAAEAPAQEASPTPADTVAAPADPPTAPTLEPVPNTEPMQDATARTYDATKLLTLKKCCREIDRLEQSSGQEGVALAGLLEDCDRLAAAIEQNQPVQPVDPEYRDEYAALLKNTSLKKRCSSTLGEYIKR